MSAVQALCMLFIYAEAIIESWEEFCSAHPGFTTFIRKLSLPHAFHLVDHGEDMPQNNLKGSDCHKKARTILSNYHTGKIGRVSLSKDGFKTWFKFMACGDLGYYIIHKISDM